MWVESQEEEEVPVRSDEKRRAKNFTEHQTQLLLGKGRRTKNIGFSGLGSQQIF